MEIIKKTDAAGESFYILGGKGAFKLFDSKEAIMSFLPLLELSWEEFSTEYIKESDQKSFLENVNFNSLLFYLFESGTDYWFVKLLGWIRDVNIPLTVSSKELLMTLLSKSKNHNVNKIIRTILRR